MLPWKSPFKTFCRFGYESYLMTVWDGAGFKCPLTLWESYLVENNTLYTEQATVQKNTPNVCQSVKHGSRYILTVWLVFKQQGLVFGPVNYLCCLHVNVLRPWITALCGKMDEGSQRLWKRKQSGMWKGGGGGADGKNKNVKQQRRLGRKADGPLTHFCLKCEWMWN